MKPVPNVVHRMFESCSLTIIYTFLQYGCFGFIAVVLWLGFAPIKRFKYRHIPGPFAWPFIGNLVPIIRLYAHNYFSQLKEQHGPIFKVWHGTQPWIIICEPDSMRKVAYKLNNHNMIQHVLLGEERYLLENVLLMLKSERWRVMRKAWDPATLHRASLEGYAPLMQECGEQLLERLEGVCQRGEVVDISQDISKMTLDVVGTCAFGIKFQSSGTDGDGSWDDEGAQLQALCAQFFRSQELDNASRWLVPLLMFPALGGLFRRLAYLMPDKGHRLIASAIRGMKIHATKIIQISRAQRERMEQATADARPTANTAASKDAAESVPAPDSGGAVTGAASGPRPSRGVLPGSFVAQLEAWRAKHEGGLEISDNLIASQVMTFLLAGYETTGNALAFLVYQLAVNQDAQRKLQAELDEALGGRKPTLDDLPQLPFLDACIKETLRISNPTVLFGRHYDCTPASPASLDILGKAIPRGAMLINFPYGAHHDPQYWERPEEFLPERFLPEAKGKLGPFNENAYLPFGAGGRKCVGYKFAEQEMALAAAALFRRFTFRRPAGEPPVRGRFGLTLAPIGGVKVLVQGRS